MHQMYRNGSIYGDENMEFSVKNDSHLIFWSLTEVSWNYVGFMVVTRSSGKAESRAVSKEICKYFPVLMKALATYQSLEEMFFKLMDVIMSKPE